MPGRDETQTWSEVEIRRMIAESAFYHAQRRGFVPGRELDDWLAAEREVQEALRRAAESSQGPLGGAPEARSGGGQPPGQTRSPAPQMPATAGSTLPPAAGGAVGKPAG